MVDGTVRMRSSASRIGQTQDLFHGPLIWKMNENDLFILLMSRDKMDAVKYLPTCLTWPSRIIYLRAITTSYQQLCSVADGFINRPKGPLDVPRWKFGSADVGAWIGRCANLWGIGGIPLRSGDLADDRFEELPGGGLTEGTKPCGCCIVIIVCFKGV